MADESGTPSPPVKRRRRPKPAVTNINIFALGPSGTGEAAPSRKESGPELQAEPEVTLVSTEWLERRSKKLDSYEQELRERAADIEIREAELEQREAEFEAEAFIRSEALEERERRLVALEEKLGHRESELGSYVARVQSGMLRADAI